MIVREKRTGEEWTCPLELELVPDFPQPGPEWEFFEDAEKRVGWRNTMIGEVRYPAPDSQWCIHIPTFEETELMPTRNLAKRFLDWMLVRPGDDTRYEFIPENGQERE